MALAPQPSPTQAAPVPAVEQTATWNGTGDATRQGSGSLPLSPNGKLLSVDQYEVDFDIPHNPLGGGVCATPVPKVNIPTGRVTAGCPFTVPCDMAANRDANIPLPGDPIKYFKLNWVVVRDASGAGSNIDQTRIDQIMTELNTDFLPWRMQFCSDPANFVTDANMYSLNVGTEDATLKNTYGTTPSNWINIYVVGSITNPNAGGYARFPYDPLGGYNIRGGVVLARGNMFLGTHTLAHELGHTFGLFHTFHGVDEVTACSACYEDMGLAGQDTEGDWCSDTRPHPTNSYVCGDAGTDACTALPFTGSPVNNHMSYSFCTSQFTSQQAGRMHCMIDTYLQNWVNFGGGTCGNQPPTADFSGTPTFWQAPFSVTYTDLSVPGPTITNWTWNFDVTGIGGVTPATFSGGPGTGNNPPPVQYTLCDTSYTVSLTVTNANGSDTETKTSYISASCPAGDCDTLDNHWTTPVSTPSFYTFSANNFVTGLPSSTFQGAGSTAPIGFYERYVTPNPGTTTVGAIRVGLGNYLDPDSNMQIQVVVYNCDPTGLPIGGPLGGFGPLQPGQDLGVPGAGFFNEFWIPFDEVVIPGAQFLVGVEMFPGQSTDRLIVVSSANGQGQGLGLNHVATNSFGYLDYLGDVGINFDLDIIPMLGPWKTEFFLTGLGSLRVCDSTLVVLTDSALFHPTMTSVTITSSKNGTITDSLLANVDTLVLLYTTPGPDTILFTTVNRCGRADTIGYILSYPFDTTPGPVDFTKNLANPICAGTSITFTGTPLGGADYLWDFGDGTVVSSGASNVQSHAYATPGLYYVTLTVTNPSSCDGTETKLDFVEIINCAVNAPLANFNASPDTVCLGDPIHFTDMSMGVPDAATGWNWAFDDGTFSLLQNPMHTYSTPGTFNVQLVASNAGGSDTAYFTVVVLSLPCTLPIDLELSAVPIGDDVFLSWEGDGQFQERTYEVLRSLDARIYAQIGERLANSQSQVPYSFVDVGPGWTQTLYYRVRAVDVNGDYHYSNVATARLGIGDHGWLQVYPIPMASGGLLYVQTYLETATALSFTVMDPLGRLVHTSESSADAGLDRHVLDMGKLSRGQYFLRVASPYGAKVRKILVD